MPIKYTQELNIQIISCVNCYKKSAAKDIKITILQLKASTYPRLVIGRCYSCTLHGVWVGGVPLVQPSMC